METATQIPVSLGITLAALLSISAILGILKLFLWKTEKEKNVETELEKLRPTKSASSEIKFQEALKLFLNTCEIKFTYWTNKDIIPLYVAKGPDHVSSAVVKNTCDSFILDVKACLNITIFESILNNYFSSTQALDIFLKQYFYNKLNAYETKNIDKMFNIRALEKMN